MFLQMLYHTAQDVVLYNIRAVLVLGPAFFEMPFESRGQCHVPKCRETLT